MCKVIITKFLYSLTYYKISFAVGIEPAGMTSLHHHPPPPAMAFTVDFSSNGDFNGDARGDTDKKLGLKDGIGRFAPAKKFTSPATPASTVAGGVKNTPNSARLPPQGNTNLMCFGLQFFKCSVINYGVICTAQFRPQNLPKLA